MKTPQFTPPPLAMRFFRAICRADFLEEIEGDLLEIYEERAGSISRARLRWLFVWEIALLIRPKLLKSFIPSSLNPFFMFQDHLKVSFRNLRKYRLYTTINLFGLSLGIGAAVLLFLVVRFEHSFDRFHTNGDQLYVVGESSNGGKPDFLNKVPLASRMKDDIPEVVAATRFGGWDSPWLETENGKIQEVIKLVDPDFALMFDFAVKQGNLEATLRKKGQIAITENVARKLFGFDVAVGREIRESQSKKVWIVGAVLKDIPSNSSFQFEVLTGWENIPDWLRDPEMANWYNTFMPAMVMLKKDVEPMMLSEKLSQIVNTYFDPGLRESTNIVLLPLDSYRSANTNNAVIINLLALVAIIIIAIASVNFVNLATAQALVRIREVTIRKVLGSTRKHLVSQILVESLLVNFLAVLAAWLVIYLALPSLESRFSIQLQLAAGDYVRLIAFTFLFAGLLGFVSGLFPALFITSMKVGDGLGRPNAAGRSGSSVRKSLLVVQFAASIFMMAGTIVVWKQIDFMKLQSLHFADDELLAVNVFSENFSDGEKALKRIRLWQNDYMSLPGVTSVSFGGNIPGRYWDNYDRFSDKDNNQTSTHLKQAYVAANYFETLGVKFIEGRSFSKDLASDSNAVVINRKAMEAYGWQSIAGKFLCQGGGADCVTRKVVGVTEDFHYRSLESNIEPLVHFMQEDYFNYVLIRFKPGRTSEVLDRLEADWQGLQAYQGLDYFFINEEFAGMYAEQERLGLSAALFSALALLIASLGLFSVASFLIRKKRKEISIRKVMGASIGQLSASLSKGYAVLLAVAFVLAIPTSYWVMKGFLEGFAYHITLSPDIYFFAAAVVIFFSAISIGVIVLRASKENPVLALRDE